MPHPINAMSTNVAATILALDGSPDVSWPNTPRLVDLYAVVRNLEPHVRRVLGDDIDLAISSALIAAPVSVAPATLEQLMLDLAANACDAMHHGGRVTIDVEPSDVRDRVCLTMRVHLPRVDATAPNRADIAPTAPSNAAAVLLAEDDAAVRRVVTRVLERLGHRVFAARSGQEAIAHLEGHAGRLDLLVADVVMPGMSAANFVCHVAQRSGPIPTLYLSGHSRDIVARLVTLSPSSRLLMKPFTATGLATAVEALLRTSRARSRP